MLFNKKFILASSSKSRYVLLKNAGLSFKKIQPLCDETSLKKKLLKNKTAIKKISLQLARLKAQSISKKQTNQIVVGSDTVINFNGKLINKAKNINEAKKTIKLMSNNSHNIYSSISVFYNNKEIWNKTEKTQVTIRSLTNKEINMYLSAAGKEILKSAGCYQLEKLGPNIIQNIKGDFFNVLGFPLFSFLFFLKKINIKNE